MKNERHAREILSGTWGRILGVSEKSRNVREGGGPEAPIPVWLALEAISSLLDNQAVDHPQTEPDAHAAVRQLISACDPDPDREGLKETPARFTAAMKFWTSGYGQSPADVLKVFEDGAESYDSLVFQGGIPVFSHCEHHLAPFFGVAHISYIPNGKIVGLSKLARVTEIFARRFQVQERLTTQVADALQKHLAPKAVGVVLRCRHHCMESRGVQKIGTVTYTSALHGTFKTDPSARAEFMQFVAQADARVTNL